MTAALLTVPVTLVLAEDATVSPRAVATIKLVDAEGEVLAATAVSAAGALPIEVDLHVDAMLAGDPQALLAWVLLRDGDAGWGTLELAAVGAGPVTLARIEG